MPGYDDAPSSSVVVVHGKSENSMCRRVVLVHNSFQTPAFLVFSVEAVVVSSSCSSSPRSKDHRPPTRQHRSNPRTTSNTNGVLVFPLLLLVVAVNNSLTVAKPAGPNPMTPTEDKGDTDDEVAVVVCGADTGRVFLVRLILVDYCTHLFYFSVVLLLAS